MGKISTGPDLDTEDGGDILEQAKLQRAHARVTFGLRNGEIAGGPQCAARIQRAAKVSGSFSERVMMGGCRACQRAGMWPAPQETIQHALLECHRGRPYDTVRWRCRVLRGLKTISSIYNKYGAAGRAGEQKVSAAAKALTRNVVPQGSWETLCEVAGGVLPEWEGGAEQVQQIKQKEDSKIVAIIQRMQLLFHARISEWTKHMAPEGQKRQQRWTKTGWLRLTFEAMRNHRSDMEPQFPAAAGTPHIACMQWMIWITSRQREEERKRERKQQRRQQLQKAILTVMEQVRQQRIVRDRLQQRGDRVCAHTRGANTAVRRNYSEAKRRNKASIKPHEQYNMRPFALTDKFGSHAWATWEKMLTATAWRYHVSATNEEGVVHATPSGGHDNYHNNNRHYNHNYIDADILNEPPPEYRLPPIQPQLRGAQHAPHLQSSRLPCRIEC